MSYTEKRTPKDKLTYFRKHIAKVKETTPRDEFCFILLNRLLDTIVHLVDELSKEEEE